MNRSFDVGGFESRVLDLDGFEFGGFPFVGFEPSEALQNFAALRFGRISGEAPSDASAVAQIVRTIQGSFEAVLTISSAAGTFAAEAVADDPMRAVQAISRRIRSQLRIWKRSRQLADA